MSLRASVSSGFSMLWTSNASHEHPTAREFKSPEGITAEQLPRAPLNPWRKRPVKLTYDRTDFEMFRLPSEKAFLLGGYDYADLFGKRKGIQHAPHIKS